MKKNKNNILIISSMFDKSTDDVMAWLLNYGATFLRVNETDIIEIERIQITNKDDDAISLIFRNSLGSSVRCKLSDFSGFWYRRGKLNLTHNSQNKNELKKAVHEYLNVELEKIEDVIEYYSINNPNSINKFSDNDQNKIKNLLIARKYGFNIPDTFILTQKKDLDNIQSKYQSLITKSIGELGSKYYDSDFQVSFDVGTKLVENSDSKDKDRSFHPSLFQKNINKIVEIRTFYLKGQMYSMAIFSQLDEQTKVDFRNYNVDKENRNVPFNLPENIEYQISKFMKEVKLNCGSLDLIYDGRNFIFLEVNPIGQFQWLSKNCNYYLEKKIANRLINNSPDEKDK